MGLWLECSIAVAVIAVCAYFYKRKRPISDLDVQGFWEPQFKEVADVFRQNLKSGFMRGATFAAYKDGKLVVDLWGGYTDEQYSLIWREDTITHAASTSKFVAAIAFSTLVDKGLVDYDDLVVKHWPEFGQHGKEKITVNQLISHQAGLHNLDTMISLREIIDDPKKIDALLASQKPAWAAGTALSYHAFTIGFYVDYLARRIDPKHRSIYQIYEEDIKNPLDLDFYLGTPLELQYRMARVHKPGFFDIVRTFFCMPYFRQFLLYSILGKSKIAEVVKSVKPEEVSGIVSDPYVREIPIAAASGAGTARALAKMAGVIAAGTTHKGRKLLSDKTVTALNTPSLSGMEILMGLPITSGHGTFIFQNPKGDNVFGYPGSGGQMSYSDPKYKVGLAFLTNYFSPFSMNDDLRFVPLEQAFYRCLDKK